MEKKIQEKIFKGTYMLEIVIAILISLGIIVSLSSFPNQLIELLKHKNSLEALREFFGYTFNIVIGIEFLRMLSKHTFSSVIEVLLFALARALIVEHTTAIENFLTILSIAVLFIIRKYLFKTNDD